MSKANIYEAQTAVLNYIESAKNLYDISYKNLLDSSDTSDFLNIMKTSGLVHNLAEITEDLKTATLISITLNDAIDEDKTIQTLVDSLLQINNNTVKPITLTTISYLTA